jgi:hypothetical protein
MLAGRLDEALDELKQVGSMWLAHAYVRAGRRAEAEKMLAGNEAYPFRLAIIYAALDDTDPAFEALARMRDTEPNRLLYLLTAPELSTLRGDVRFAALRKSLNLPPEAPSDPTP